MTTDAPTGPEAAGGPGGTVEMDAERITTSTRDPETMRDQFERWLRATLPEGSDAEVVELTSPESNGMSSETLLVDRPAGPRTAPTVARRLVARVEPPATDYPVFTTYDLDMQFRVMRLVAEHTDVPVPATHWYEPDPSVLGGVVLRHGPGRRPGPARRPALHVRRQLGVRRDRGGPSHHPGLGRAGHGRDPLDPARRPRPVLPASWTSPGPPRSSAASTTGRRYHEWVVGDTRSPLLDDCFAWLTENLPTDTSPDALSWGDGRIGNMMFRDNEVVAVLDWEMAAVAPPEVDLGWMCYLHLFFQDLAVQLGAPGLPDMFRPADVAGPPTPRPPATELGDLTWHIAYAAMRHGVIMRRVTERSIFFGEARGPADIDDLIIHRATLAGMLDGTYWEGVAL